MNISHLVVTTLLSVIKASPNCTNTTEGCGRKVEYFEPSTLRPQGHLADVSTTPAPHRLPCTTQEESEKGCLNGGTCFVVEFQGSRQVHCACTEDWRGERCQFINFPNIFESRGAANARTAYIGGGVAVAAILIIIFIIAIAVYVRRRRKDKRLKNHEFEASAEQLYRKPFSKRSSIVESLSRPNSLRRAGPSEGESKNEDIPLNGGTASPDSSSNAYGINSQTNSHYDTKV